MLHIQLTAIIQDRKEITRRTVEGECGNQRRGVSGLVILAKC